MRALLYLLLISINIVLPSVCFGQLVTTSNSIKEIISDDYHPKSGGAYLYNNPVNNWPACSAPSDLNFQLDGKGNLTLSWDGDEKQMQNYQYEIKFPEGVLNTDKNIVTVSRNKYNIRRTDIGPRSDLSVSVRRKCFINKDVFYSNWVTQEITLPEPANTNSETCPHILEYVNFIANSASGNEVNDTLYLFNFSFDSMDVKLTYNYWFSPWKSSDPPTIVSITTIKRVRFGSFYKIPIARIKPVEVVFAQKFHGGITTTLACPPVIVQPNACNVNAYVYHTKTNDLNENLVLVKVGVSNGILNGSIISNQDTFLLIDGLGTISTCSDVTVNLSLQTIINGVNTTVACDPMIIENECLCIEPQSNINNRTFNVIQPNCDNSTGDVYTSFPMHLTSIGGEFSDTTSYNNLPPGVYYLRIKNIYTNCVSAPYMFTIDEQPPINEDVNAAITQQMGCNGEKGIIEISDPEVNYLYSLGGNFGTSTSFSNLNAGYYQVSSKNPQGCISISDTLWVIQANTPPTPQVTLIQPSCSPVVSTGTITINSPTGSNYSYAVNSGTFQSSPVFSGLANGTYSVTVKSNITGCIAVLTNVTINAVPNMVIPNASVTIQPSCTASTGTIFVSSPIGPQYTYSVGGSYQSSRNFSNLQPGTYYVTLKLSSGCISSPKVLTVNANVPAASVTSQPTCTTITGTIGFTSPAGADINYSINDGASWQSGSTFSNLSPGTYLCKYKNTSSNCISQALTLLVNQPPTFAAPEVSITQATCSDLFGTIQVVSPLGSEFSYSINTIEPNFQSSPVFSNKPSGIYSVKVRNNDSYCYSQITVVEISPLPAVPATPSLSIEDPSCLISTGKISVDSPLGSEYVYSINQINYSPVPVFTNLAPGNYSVTAKNIVSGCVSTAGAATVAEAPENEISAVITGSNTLCLGDSTVLIASGGVTYNWNQNLGSGPAKLIYPTVNTTYTVTVTDQNGCTASSSKMIIIASLPVAAITGNLNPCLNESTTLTASGGSAYLWNNGATNASIAVVLNNTTQTSYTVTVTSNVGCVSTQSAIVAPVVCNNGCQVTFSGPEDNEICAGESALISAEVTGCSGQGYLWSTGATTNAINVSPSETTYYYVTITSNDQSTIFTYTLNVNQCFCQFSNIQLTPLECNNNSYDLQYTFTITDIGNSGDVHIHDIYGNSAIHTVNGPGTYTGILPSNLADGQQRTVYFEKSSYTCTANANYIALAPCNDPLPNSCTIQYTEGACNGEKYNVSGTVKVADPIAGSMIIVTDYPSENVDTIMVVANVYSYGFQIIDLVPDGTIHTIFAGGLSCADATPSVQYNAPSICDIPQCRLMHVEEKSSECNPSNNTYKLDGMVEVDCEKDDIITITILPENISVLIATQSDKSQFEFLIENLNADGLQHSVIYYGQFTDTITSTFNAPQPCRELPEVICGNTYAPPSITNNDLLPTAAVGDIFSVSGINFKVITISGSNGTFSGQGSMAIPFSSKKLLVSFNGIKVNTFKEVFEGTVEGVSGPFNLQSTIPIDTLSIGGDICQVDSAPEGMDDDGHDSVTGLNDRGFGRDSLFYPDSTRYDPNGFDYNGISRDNGTPYNEFGCNMKGLDIEGNACKVDSTLITMRDSLLGQILPGLLDSGILNALDKLVDSLSTFDCDALRIAMNAKITALGYDRKYITGASDEYFVKGMHKNFESEPKPLLNNANRSQDAVDLEAKHIELYRCDMLTEKLEEMKEKLQDVDKNLLNEYIKKELKKLNKTDLQALMENSDALRDWVLVQINNYLDPSNHIGFLDQQPNNHNENSHEGISISKTKLKRDRSSTYYSTAYSGSDADAFDFTPAPGEEETWLYNQGYKEIKGVSRAYYMDEAYRQIEQYNLIMAVDEDTPLYQPVLMSKDSAGVTYNIYVDKIILTPSSAKLDAYFVLNLPNSNDKKLVLQAENLNWGAGGMIGDTRLKLATAVEIRVSNAALLRLNPGTTSSDGCFVSWDCNGFKSIGLDADIELCRDFITPLNPTTFTEIPAPARFSVNVKMELRHWSDFYFSLNANDAKAFYITGYSDYKFKVKGMTVDMSDYRSPQLNSRPGPFMKEWRGFHLEEMTVTFPNSFSSGSNHITAGVKDFVIDDMGVSGKIFAANLLSIDNGSLGGWPFSIDTAMVIVEKNHLTGGGLAGRLKVPVFKNAMKYNASILPGNKYNFSISPSATEEMDMLLAQVTLDSNSTITVRYDNNDVIATAILNGSIQVGSQSDTSGVSLPSARFKNFKISNTAPYFNAGEWTISGGIGGNIAGFEIKIDNIRPIQPNETEAGLSFNIGVQFPCDLAAYGGFEIIGNMQLDAHGRQEWVHNRTKLNRLGIDAKFAAGHVKGYLETFEDHPTYGKGFQGLVGMDFKGIGSFDALALFGKKDFKYFFIDAQATLSTGIPVGPIEINGFVGGVSYKMGVQPTANGGMSNSTTLPSVLGQSFSGNTYTPNADYALGLRAGVKMRMAKNPKIFNGEVVFEILFNAEKPDGTGGGVAQIVLDGKGMLMAVGNITGQVIESTNSKPKGMNASLTAHIRFKYDFNADIFTGDLIAYLNAGIFKGVGAGGKMVDAHIYVGPDKWYFHFGTPSNPCGLLIDSPVLRIEMKSYLCIGTNIPGLPPVPADVIAIAGNIKPSSAFANNGNGFLFGSSFDVKAGINLGIASAQMNAKAGFDIMVRDFGDAKCKGDNDVIGINGWYGVGQMWAKIEGKLKLLGFTLFDAGIAGILQAQLPNPFFAQATMGVRVKTLFGTLNKKMKIKLGEECQIDYGDDGSALGIKVINVITPGDGAIEMPTDVVPQVMFNVPINTIMDIGDKFEVKLDSVSIKSLKTGLKYNYASSLLNDSTLLEIIPTDVFNGKDSIEMIVKVKVLRNGSLTMYERERIVFTTMGTYSTIPAANIESSYPADGMANFYKGEYNQYKGFIQMKSGMPELFYNIPEGTTQKIKLTKNGAEPMVFDYVYNGLEAKIEFPMDTAMLHNGQLYKLEIVRFPKGAYATTIPGQGVDINTQASGLNLSNIMGNPVLPNINESQPPQNGEVIVASLNFRVSQYSTFKKKLASMQKVNAVGKKNPGYQQNVENFDEYEVKSMIDFYLENSDWVDNLKSTMYDRLPTDLDEITYYTGNNCNKRVGEGYDTKYEDLFNNLRFITPAKGVSENNPGNAGITKGFIECSVGLSIIGDFNAVKYQIQNRFGPDFCGHLTSIDGVHEFNFDPQLLYPQHLRYYFDPANKPVSPVIYSIIKYNIPGVGTTTTHQLKFD